MDYLVKVNDTLYINLKEAVKVEVQGTTYLIHVREGDGSLTAHYCSPGAPGYDKLKKILTKAV